MQPYFFATSPGQRPHQMCLTRSRERSAQGKARGNEERGKGNGERGTGYMENGNKKENLK